MAKIKRKIVTVEALSYNFDQRYNEAMEQFDDVDVINIHVMNFSYGANDITEKYLVFYREIEEPDED